MSHRRSGLRPFAARSVLAALLAAAALVTLAACGDAGSGAGTRFRFVDAAAPPAPGAPPAGDPAACVTGEVRCGGAARERCIAGRWLADSPCAEGLVCHPEAGCIEPDACTLAAVERSNVGCVYYAADLPQPRVSSWPLVVGNPWRARMGVVVSNPWPEPLTLRVERNDAEPGSSPRVEIETTATVGPNSIEVIPLPPREVSGLDSDSGPPSRSRLSNAAWRITTSLPVVAYQLNPLANEGIFSDDASLLVPAHALDESYLAIGWPGQGNAAPAGFPADNRSFLTILATVPGTRVRVVPSCAVQPGDGVPALAAGQELEVRLDELGVLNLQGADFATAGFTDFTGTRIEADHPVSVFSGVEAITISPPNEGFCCADHLEEQLIPRSALGSDYAVARSAPRRPVSRGEPEPDYFKILAISDGTEVRTSLPAPDDAFVLARGEHRLVLSAAGFVLSASAPLVVAQFLMSGEIVDPEVRDPFTGETTGGDSEGDPSFITVPPVVQHRTQYRFLVPPGYDEDHALVAAPAGAELRLDGRALACSRSPLGTIDGTAYEGLRCRLEDGPHLLESDVPFGLVIEGWGPGVVSYGFTGGMDFEPVNADCVEDTECPGGEFCSGGYCVPEIDFI